MHAASILPVEDMTGIVDETVDTVASRYGVKPRLPSLIGVASAEDPAWRRLRVHGLKMPYEILPGARSVIVIAVPLSREAVESNAHGDEPSHQWLLEYGVLNQALREASRKLAEALEALGWKSAPLKPTHDFGEEKLASTWSHRHAGVIAGLGEIGLNNMLVTEKGCAVRLTSIITTAPLAPTPKSRAACTRCGACLDACPIDALRRWERGGKRACYKRLIEVDSKHRKVLGFTVDACGKCIARAPCSLASPTK